MKNKRMLFITVLVCLSPILLGLALWNALPESIAIHFDINNTPDNFAPKWVAVFALPVMMAVLQVICCIINDVNAKKHGERKKFGLITKWILPVMSVVLQILTFGYSLGWNVDIRRAVALILGVIFVVIGNYLPKFDYIKHYDLSAEKAKKINRFIGFETVIMGILFLASIFFPAGVTLACVFLLIPYAAVAAIYGIKVGKSK